MLSKDKFSLRNLQWWLRRLHGPSLITPFEVPQYANAAPIHGVDFN